MVVNSFSACAVLTFDPAEGFLDLDVQMNNESIFHKSYSGKKAFQSAKYLLLESTTLPWGIHV